jgi:hypothetical protein
MASTFKFHSQINEVVPWQAQYSFPTQSTKVSKQTVKLHPKNGSSFSESGIIRIEFPADNYLNCLNSVLLMDITLTGTSVRFQRGGAHNAIKRLRIMYGSLVLEDIQEYKTLVRMFTEASVQQDYATSSGTILDGMYDVMEVAPGMSTTAILTADTAANAIVSASTAAIALSATTVTRTYALSLLSGILTSKKLLPLKWMASQLSIEITLATAKDACLAATDTPAMTVDQCMFLAEMLEFDSAYDSAFYEGLSQGVPIKFASWHYHHFNMNGATSQLQVHERSRSVKSAFAVVTSSDAASARADSDIFFFDVATTNGTDVIAGGGCLISEYQWRVGGRYYPAQPVRCDKGGAEAYLELQKCLDCVGDYTRASNINYLNWAPLATATAGQKFIMCAEFENTDVMPDSIAGINAEEQSDISLTIKTSGTTPTAKQIDVFVHYDALLIIREGNLVDLVM